ncbi:MAG: glutamate racemase [Oscillospiraceae bacterium]|nr:glutamate racemase [Oscillospiraceae bacterium]
MTTDTSNITKNSAIGVFDSGMGGLTAVRELRRLMPHEDIIYLGDTARVPYGTKSRETITKYALQDFAFLKQFGVKLTIAACGTVSSVVAPESLTGEGLYTGVIRPAVLAAINSTKNGKIAVIGTSATIRSGSYKRLINEIMPEAEVYEKDCPMFVPLVENGFVGRDNLPCSMIAREYLEPLKKTGVDTLIMGCTHYPIIADVIGDVMGDGVRLISSGGEAGRYASELLRENNLLSDRENDGKMTLYCTDSVELFRENAVHFLGEIDNAEIKGCTLEPSQSA